MTKQILIVVDSINVNDSSGSKANVALIKNLAAVGYVITVLHFTQENIQFEGVECISIKERKYNILYFLSRTQRVIQRNFKINLATYLEPVFGFSFTFFNDVNSILVELKKLDVLKFDLVLTLSKGASFRPHYAVNKLPVLYEKWMAYIHDPFPMCCYPPPYNWNEPGHKQKQLFFENLSKNARCTAFPSKLLKDWMGTYFPVFLKTGIIIPHQSFEEELISFEKPNYYDSAKFNILHAGNLMKQRNPEGLIKGFELFLKNKPEAKEDSQLLLLGNADYHKESIIKHAVSLPELFIKLTNVPFKEVYWLQKHVAVNVILEAKSEISPFLPGKFPHCISADKPILHLGPDHSETKRLLGEKYEYWAEIDNVKAISGLLEKLYIVWLNKAKTSRLNRPDLDYYLGKEYLKEQLEKVFDND
ncbi:glycosyltransferase family 4 protein [Yeosuana marina]|uniref:glycosyltransferase family 4 protein n=1 Tax=Yeosuana marina TaxID=1565536 RepID=UPI0014221112|nr:glycosyltransferase family 4 protein [Yeosuana marina]